MTWTVLLTLRATVLQLGPTPERVGTTQPITAKAPGTSAQASQYPALVYADYDGDGNGYICSDYPETIPEIAIANLDLRE